MGYALFGDECQDRFSSSPPRHNCRYSSRAHFQKCSACQKTSWCNTLRHRHHRHRGQEFDGEICFKSKCAVTRHLLRSAAMFLLIVITAVNQCIISWTKRDGPCDRRVEGLIIFHPWTLVTTYICILCILNGFEWIVLDEKQCNMNWSFAHSDQGADVGVDLTAMSAACAHNLILPTSVSRKSLKVDIAKGIDTSSKVIVKELENICNEKDAHNVRSHSGESLLQHDFWCDLLSGRFAKLVGTVPVNRFEYRSNTSS